VWQILTDVSEEITASIIITQMMEAVSHLHRLRVFGNSVVRIIFRPKTEEL
jgi:hypothetical protein